MRYWFPQLLPYFIFIICQLTQRSSDPPSSPPATYRLPGASFGPVHFTEYPLKPEYKDYTSNNILAWDLLARTIELTRYNQEGPCHPSPPNQCLPLPPSSHWTNTNKLFGIVYITLMGVIDTIVPTASLWLCLGKSITYLIKLAPILWWALPTQSVTRQFPNTSKPANQGWFPDKDQMGHLEDNKLQKKSQEDLKLN
ncbi:hypothetical protein DSO57_1011427 [Entomophthora muscae]|uniref:Uncharacterized protein n=1 Tax=Entomophthora muscae TaxID=34485 RepID=A0ACC2UR18_9FUNG|nr:hypothetical protein DSO57_1011427 [Entomophthora muscae]